MDARKNDLYQCMAAICSGLWISFLLHTMERSEVRLSYRTAGRDSVARWRTFQQGISLMNQKLENDFSS